VAFAKDLKVTHHVTATLRPGLPKVLLEDRLGEWVTRVNRTYLGRNWFKAPQKERRMQGLVFFELGRGLNNPHAHLLLRPPSPADPWHFEVHAPFIFAGSPSDENSRVFRPLAPGGSLVVQRIGPSETDLARVTGYDTKEMEFRSQSYEDWKYIDDLSRRMAGR